MTTFTSPDYLIKIKQHTCTDDLPDGLFDVKIFRQGKPKSINASCMIMNQKNEDDHLAYLWKNHSKSIIRVGEEITIKYWECDKEIEPLTSIYWSNFLGKSYRINATVISEWGGK